MTVPIMEVTASRIRVAMVSFKEQKKSHKMVIGERFLAVKFLSPEVEFPLT